MRKLTATEKRLGLAFALALFLVLNLFLVRLFGQQLGEERGELARLGMQIAEYEELLEERPYWEARAAWIETNPPPVHTGQETESQFAEEVQRSLERMGLKIERQELEVSERNGNLVVASLGLEIQGRLEPLIRWLQEVQQPGNYCDLQRFTLKRADVETNILAQVKIRKVFRSHDAAKPE